MCLAIFDRLPRESGDEYEPLLTIFVFVFPETKGQDAEAAPKTDAAGDQGDWFPPADEESDDSEPRSLFAKVS